MKFGIRTPSLKKRIAARTSWKRIVRHSMGLKAPRGYGWLTNPKRAAYNRIYNRTTVDIFRLPKTRRKSYSVGALATNALFNSRVPPPLPPQGSAPQSTGLPPLPELTPGKRPSLQLRQESDWRLGHAAAPIPRHQMPGWAKGFALAAALMFVPVCLVIAIVHNHYVTRNNGPAYIAPAKSTQQAAAQEFKPIAYKPEIPLQKPIDPEEQLATLRAQEAVAQQARESAMRLQQANQMQAAAQQVTTAQSGDNNMTGIGGYSLPSYTRYSGSTSYHGPKTQYVHSYTRKNGTTVRGYYRSHR